MVQTADDMASLDHYLVTFGLKMHIGLKKVQGWAKERALGCVNPTSWFLLATGREFTQPRAHLLAEQCTIKFE